MEADKLQALLKFLLDTLQEGKAFTVEQAPQFVQELLKWQFYEAVFFAGSALLFGAVAQVAIWSVVRRMLAKDIDHGAVSFVRIVAVAVSLSIALANIHTAIKVKVAPRVVLVEAVRGLISR